MTLNTSPISRRPYRPKIPDNRPRLYRTGRGLPAATTAAMAKLLVATALMRHGWDVFRPLSQASFFDLLAISRRTRRVLKLEVRTGYRSPTSGVISYPKAHTEGKTVAVVVFSETPAIYFARLRTRRLTLKFPLP